MKICSGVPQGLTFGPLLFLVLKSGGVDSGFIEAFALLFADDSKTSMDEKNQLSAMVLQN